MMWPPPIGLIEWSAGEGQQSLISFSLCRFSVGSSHITCHYFDSQNFTKYETFSLHLNPR